MRKIPGILQTLFLFLLVSNLLPAQDYASYNALAKKEYEGKNYYNAIDYASRSLSLSANGEAYWWRAMSRYYLKNYSDAESDFGYAMNYYGSDNGSLAKLYSWRGDCRIEQKKYNDALADYQKSLTYGPESKLHIYWNEGVAYYNIFQYQESMNAYSSAIAVAYNAADLASLYKERGDAKGMLYKYDDAIADFSKAIEYDSRMMQAYWQRGFYRGKEGLYELAIGDFTSAIRLFSQENTVGASNDLSILYNNRGLYYYRLRKYEEARADMVKSIDQNPNYDYANWNMGLIETALGHHKAANGFYLQAVSLMKKEIDRAACYFDLYKSDRALLDYGKAMAHINEAIRINPDKADYYWSRAYLYGIRHENAKGLAEYEKVMGLYANDSSNLISIYDQRGWLKVKTNDNPGALRDFQKAVELNTGYYNSYYELGRFFKEVMKQPELAKLNLSKAANLSLAYDTTSSYAYAKAVNGEQAEAIRVIESIITKESSNADRLKWELHNAGCIYALVGNIPKSIKYIEQSLIAGYDDFDHLINDRDLESIKASAVYKALLVKYKVPVPVY